MSLMIKGVAQSQVTYKYPSQHEAIVVSRETKSDSRTYVAAGN